MLPDPLDPGQPVGEGQHELHPHPKVVVSGIRSDVDVARFERFMIGTVEARESLLDVGLIDLCEPQEAERPRVRLRISYVSRDVDRLTCRGQGLFGAKLERV